MKKRIVSILLLLSFMVLCAASALAADTATIKAKTNLYKSPTTSGGTVAAINAGTTVDVLGSTTSFYKVKASGKNGYVLKSKVWLDEQDTKADDPPPTDDEDYCYTHGAMTGIEMGMTQSHVSSIMAQYTPKKVVDNPDLLIYEEPLITNSDRKIQYHFWFTDNKLVALEASTDGLLSGEDVMLNYNFFYYTVSQIEGDPHYQPELYYALDSDYAIEKFYKQIENSQMNYTSRWAFKDFSVSVSIVQGFSNNGKFTVEDERLKYPRATLAIYSN